MCGEDVHFSISYYPCKKKNKEKRIHSASTVLGSECVCSSCLPLTVTLTAKKIYSQWTAMTIYYITAAL